MEDLYLLYAGAKKTIPGRPKAAQVELKSKVPVESELGDGESGPATVIRDGGMVQ